MCARLAFLSLAKCSSVLSDCFPSITIRYVSKQQTRHLTMSAYRREVVTLDCTGTIMRIKGSLPRLYLGVLEERLGVEEGGIPGVSEPALLDTFRASLKQRSRELPCFGAGVMSSEEWWAEVVKTAYRGAGVPEEHLSGVFDEVFDHLFHHVFTRGLAWELVPGAKEVIGDLRAWCEDYEGPLALGVVSNFDERLHPLLQNLGVYDSFDFVLTSRECGSQKPDPHMFYEALKRAGSREAHGVGVHIGDTFGNDVMGARGVGWDSVLITGRRDPSDGEKKVQHIRVGELTDVPAALGISR